MRNDAKRSNNWLVVFLLWCAKSFWNANEFLIKYKWWSKQNLLATVTMKKVVAFVKVLTTFKTILECAPNTRYYVLVHLIYNAFLSLPLRNKFNGTIKNRTCLGKLFRYRFCCGLIHG